MIRKEHVTRSNFNGKLYCVQVPNGRIVVRSKDSSPILTGNCGIYVARCFQVCNMEIPKNWMRAKDWCNWGVKIAKPMDGCVVVFEREGGGHVGFVVGETVDGFLSVLGGNQKNKVSIAKFNKDRVVGYYWPKEVPVPSVYILSKVYGGGEVSTNEA